MNNENELNFVQKKEKTVSVNCVVDCYIVSMVSLSIISVSVDQMLV